MAAQPLLGNGSNLLAVNRDRSALRVIEAEQQIDDRAFSRTGVPDQCYSFTRTCFKGYITQDKVFFVGEGDVIEHHIALVARHRTVCNGLTRLIHQCKYAACGDHGAVQVRELVHHTGNRLEHPSEHIDKSIENAKRHESGAVQTAEPEIPQYQHKREIAQ
ncbi:hypothetical protein D3C75_1071400 [compost metagenome]